MELSFVELFRGGSSRTRTGFAGEGEINKTKVQNVKQTSMSCRVYLSRYLYGAILPF